MNPKRDDIFTDAFHELLKDYLVESNPTAKDQLRDKIVAHCLPFVHRLAKSLARRSTDPVDDLIQVGSLGLIKALEKFNPLSGNRFKTYATYLITGEMRHYLRDRATIVRPPRRCYELYYRMNQIVQHLAEDLGRTPTDLEIAEELECSLERVHEMGVADRRRAVVSLDQFVAGTEGSSGDTIYVERLVDDKNLEALQNQERRILLEEAMKRLNPDLYAVIQLTYFEDMSQYEIATTLGISQMQVSRRLRKALDRLHKVLRHEQLGLV